MIANEHYKGGGTSLVAAYPVCPNTYAGSSTLGSVGGRGDAVVLFEFPAE